jgi:hypothetical protein
MGWSIRRHTSKFTGRLRTQPLDIHVRQRARTSCLPYDLAEISTTSTRLSAWLCAGRTFTATQHYVHYHRRMASNHLLWPARSQRVYSSQARIVVQTESDPSQNSPEPRTDCVLLGMGQKPVTTMVLGPARTPPSSSYHGYVPDLHFPSPTPSPTSTILSDDTVLTSLVSCGIPCDVAMQHYCMALHICQFCIFPQL